MEVLLSSRDMSVGYEKKVVVDGITFTVRPGEILTLIGANGSGKSTILKTITSLLPVVSGNVYIDDKDMAMLSQHDIAQVISAMYTSRLTSERMTCYEVVATGRYPYTGRFGILSEDDRRIVWEAMEMAAVTHLAETDFNLISDGQRQIVMLARALAQQPLILVLDEPTSFLDINNKLRLLSLLRKLSTEKGIGVVQSLHELDLAQRFSDKLLCIKNGKADRFGTPDEIFSGEYISRLYDIDKGVFIPEFGICESEKPSGIPEIFVIGGGGAGIPVYRELARQGTPFIAGIIFENDIDYPIAKALAAAVISEKAFEPIGLSALNKAEKIITHCKRIICTRKSFGGLDDPIVDLIGYAEDNGIHIDYI